MYQTIFAHQCFLGEHSRLAGTSTFSTPLKLPMSLNLINSGKAVTC
jgi:hypothetical protein